MSRKRQSVLFYPHGDPNAQLTTLSYDYDNGELLADHYHNEDQLIFASKGVMTIRTAEGVWIVPPQRAVWIPAKVVHSIRMSGDVSMRTLYFRPRFVKVLPKRCLVINVAPLLRELIVHACEFSKMSTRVRKEKRVIDLIMDQLESHTQVPLQLPIPSDLRAKRVAETLIADPSDKRLLTELCRESGASKRTVERLFLEQVGTTFGKWRQQLRMLSSIQRLASGEKVTSAALEAGYSSPSAFISVFKKLMGSTPSNYFD